MLSTIELYSLVFEMSISLGKLFLSQKWCLDCR